MEQPPGSLDDLQPQDLSISSLPTVIDLTRKSEECVLNATSLDAVRMVKSPGWYPNSATSSTGLPFSETGSSNIQSGDQIQPDNAFSHTTVTLSYVSRSHVFTAHESLSGHSPLYGVQSISKFSLHPPPSDSEKGLGETDYALNQHYLEHVDRPMDLATQTELFQSLSQAQVGPEDNGQNLKEFNGADVEEHLGDDEAHNLDSLQNGQGDSWSSSEMCAESPPETPNADTKENTESENSDVLFLMSTKQDALVIPRNEGSRDICLLGREFISPLEDPVSPSATSLDDVEDVFILPQASSSPSADNSFLDTADEGDGLRTQEATEPNSTTGDSTPVLHSSDRNKHRRKAVLEPLIDLTEDACMSDVLEENLKKTIHVNGNARALQRTLKEKRLPVRSGRGTRLDAIVMNINSSRYKVSGCIRTNKKSSQTTTSDSTTKSPQKNSTLTQGKRKITAKASFSEKKVKQKTRLKRGQTNNLNTDSCKDSTSDSEIINNSPRSTKQLSPQQSKKKPEDASQQGRSPQTAPIRLKRKCTSESGLQFGVHENSKKLENSPRAENSLEVHVTRISPSKSPKKSQGTAKGKVTRRKASPAAKTKAARTPKRSRKKLKRGQSSFMFSPKEPEIKLKYVNYKEERRETRFDTFSPFIRVESKESSPSLCTIINYPEEVRTQHKKGHQQQGHSSGFVSAVVPSTSCLQLGRPSTHSQHQRLLVCCLCGLSANAMDLGDLHGPYYPEGYQPSTKTPASTSGLKEDEDDDYSDSDSSSCSIRGRRRKCAVPPAPWSLRQGTQLKLKDRLESRQWTDGTGSPAAKRARSDTNCTDVEDWYSPPLLPLEPCEYWLHEDCGIWSAGVFLVKGKVYGLEEAVKVAQETMCSACREPGATLGCFFKGCPNKYHYRCALESDCVLIEENFSMKCKKHKNKTFKAPPGSRWVDR